MKKLLTLSLLALLCASVFAQQVVLVFTGKDAITDDYVRLSRIEITDLTQGWTETLTYPDTTAILTVCIGNAEDNTGIEENVATADFGLSQNNPNPFSGTTGVNLNLTESGAVTMEITDVNGRLIAIRNFSGLHSGRCQFRVNVSDAGVYFLTARQNGQTSSVKMVNNGKGGANGIEYVDNIVESLRATTLQQKNGSKGIISRPFAYGDAMTYKGFAIVGGEEIEGEIKAQAQMLSENITLLVQTTARPCPGTPTVSDVDGNTYATVQIGSQCWMAENLRTTKYTDGTAIAQGSSTSTTMGYWYYPNNDSINKSTYGLLYNWKAVMGTSSSSSSNPSGVQGVCPTGWHVPSDAEWTQLIGYVSTEVSYHCGGISTYIAKALASQDGWNSDSGDCTIGNTPTYNNATGFGALPAGYYDKTSKEFGSYVYYWTATESNSYGAFNYNMNSNSASVTCSNIIKYRSQFTARTAPRCPKVHHEGFPLCQQGLDVGVRNFNGHNCIMFIVFRFLSWRYADSFVGDVATVSP